MKPFNKKDWCHHPTNKETMLFSDSRDVLLAYSILLMKNSYDFTALEFTKAKIELSKSLGLPDHLHAAILIVKEAIDEGVWN